MELYNEQYKLEKKIKNNFITDTSLNIISIYNNKISELVGNTLKNNYDLVFYLPIEFDLQNYYIKHFDKDYQKYIDMQLLKFYEKYDINYITITGTVKERVFKIIRNILK